VIEVKKMVSPVRFVQCSGFCFDSRSWDGPAAWAVKRNQDLWQTFEEVLTLCRTEKADFLFLVGNLFEQEYARKETVERVARSLAGLEGTRVFVTPGEKDPLVLTSAYRLATWPANVHIFAGGISQIEIPSPEITIYGAGWTAYRQGKTFFDGFPAGADHTRIRLMLLYAEIASAKNSEGFLPLAEELVAASGLTYLALGRQQNWSGVRLAGETYWADCGSVEARSFQEDGPHGVLLGETDGEVTRIDFRELGQRRYLQKLLSVKNATPEAIASQLLADTTPEQRRKDLFRLNLTDSFPEAEKFIQTLQKLLTAEFSFLEILSGQKEAFSRFGTPPARPKIFPSLPQTFNQEIQKHLAKASTDEERRHWELVKKIGLTALSQTRQASLPEDELEREGIFFWPAVSAEDFSRKVANLRHTGDENISLAQAWDSLARAKRKVEEQEDRIREVRTAYETLKLEWETANRLQEEQRLLRIEIKNLENQKEHLNEKITYITKVRKRLAILKQNPDFRDLRQMQGELALLEEILGNTVSELAAYTSDPAVDRKMLRRLRQECMVWLRLQKKSEHLTAQVEPLHAKVDEIQNYLQLSPYLNIPDSEEHTLHQAEVERSVAQKELESFSDLDLQVKSVAEAYNKENEKLNDYIAIAQISEADERKITQIVKRLGQRSVAKTTGFVGLVRERTGMDKRLNSRLIRYFSQYQVADYDEFLRKKKEYQDQKALVADLKVKLEDLAEKTNREKELRLIVNSRNQLLKQACAKAKAPDFPTWLQGWAETQKNKLQLAEVLDQLNAAEEQLRANEKKMAGFSGQVRSKLSNWTLSQADVDEILETIMKVANLVRTKEEAEKEYAPLKEQYEAKLDGRSMADLEQQLEPLADLEREGFLSDEEWKANLNACLEELKSLKAQLLQAGNKLRSYRPFPVTPDLVEKLENTKLEWQTHEDLRYALEDTEDLLETSREKWQARHGDDLEARVQHMISRTFSAPGQGAADRNNLEMKQLYFAYRLTLTLAALEESSTPETPLRFSVQAKQEPQEFWEDILAYFEELSLSRTVIFKTADSGLRQLAENYQDSLQLENNDLRSVENNAGSFNLN
jgi:hypothetical protein